MSGGRLDRTRRVLDEFNAGGTGPVFDAYFTADVQFRDELGELDNLADLRAYIESFREALGGLHADFEDVREVGDTLVIVVNQGGRGAISGAEVEQHFTWLLTFRGELCERWQIYADHDEALRAAGLQASP